MFRSSRRTEKKAEGQEILEEKVSIRIAGQRLSSSKLATPSRLVPVNIPTVPKDAVVLLKKEIEKKEIERRASLPTFKYTLPVPVHSRRPSVTFYENYETIEKAMRLKKVSTFSQNTNLSVGTRPNNAEWAKGSPDKGYYSGQTLSPIRKNGVCSAEYQRTESTLNNSIRRLVDYPVRMAPPPPTVRFSSDKFENSKSYQQIGYHNPEIYTRMSVRSISEETEYEELSPRSELNYATIVHREELESTESAPSQTEKHEYLKLLGYKYQNTSGFIQRPTQVGLMDYLRVREEQGIPHLSEGSSYSGPCRGSIIRLSDCINQKGGLTISDQLYGRENEYMIFENASIWNRFVHQNNPERPSKNKESSHSRSTQSVRGNQQIPQKRGFFSWLWKKVFIRK